MKNFVKDQYVTAFIGNESILCKIEKIDNDKVTVSDGNHLYVVNFEDLTPVEFGINSKDDIKTKKGYEMVNHPNHYHPGMYEAINVIEAWNLSFSLGSAIKYISRLGLKPDASLNNKQKMIEDLKKASWYINREIERLSK